MGHAHGEKKQGHRAGPAFHREGVVGLAAKIAAGEVSAVDVAQAFLDRIAHHDGELHAFLHVDGEGALSQAAAIDRARARGEKLGPLAGVPVALKDNLCTRGVPTTCASKILAGWVPPYDAHVVERLRGAGAVVVGKTNMDEFAMGSSSESSAFGPVKNPWDLTRAPGGSSGGSAAAAAAGLASAALGSDTGGSVRQPGAFCGLVALKPTYGRVSRYGLVAFASSLDQIGPMARSTRDVGRVLSVIAGHDARDATSAMRGLEDYEAACGAGARGLAVGVVRSALGEGTDPAVAAAIERSITALRELGCSIHDVELPHARYGVSAYYLIAPAEASSNLARYDGVRYGLRVTGEDLIDTYARTRAAGFGPEVKRRIMLGTYALSAGYYDAFYLKAQKVRTLIRRDFDEAFAKCDVVLGPTAPTPAFRLGEKVDDPLAMYLADIFTLPASLAGVPAISVPCGDAGGLPIGLHLVAPPFEEARLLRVAAALEGVTDYVARWPAAYA
jgi:aspartyl-tRNA(Asn)/glutamyl-tRNA(Gln) amidotransferase subunit A